MSQISAGAVELPIASRPSALTASELTGPAVGPMLAVCSQVSVSQTASMRSRDSGATFSEDGALLATSNEPSGENATDPNSSAPARFAHSADPAGETSQIYDAVVAKLP